MKCKSCGEFRLGDTCNNCGAYHGSSSSGAGSFGAMWVFIGLIIFVILIAQGVISE